MTTVNPDAPAVESVLAARQPIDDVEGDALSSEPVNKVVETLDPVVETLDPVVETLDPVVETLDPVVETLDPVVETLDPVVETLDPVVDLVGASADDSSLANGNPAVGRPAIPRFLDVAPPDWIDTQSGLVTEGVLVRDAAAPAKPPPATSAFAELLPDWTPGPIQPTTSLDPLFGAGVTSSSSAGGYDFVPLGLLGSLVLFVFVWRALITWALTRPPSLHRLVPVPPG